MAPIVTPLTKEKSEEKLEKLAQEVFLKSIEVLGGLKQLAEFRTLTWLASLARASFAVVLKEEYLKSDEYIAEFLGLTKNTVRNMLRADEEEAIKKVKNQEELKEENQTDLHTHIAGGIAKHAYKLIKKEKQEA